MEPKYFVLLMLMPMILIGIVVYTDLNPDITGSVVSGNQQNNVLGTYSITPSFRVKTDYDIEQEYGNIKKALQGAINECRDSISIETCLKQKADELHWN